MKKLAIIIPSHNPNEQCYINILNYWLECERFTSPNTQYLMFCVTSLVTTLIVKNVTGLIVAKLDLVIKS